MKLFIFLTILTLLSSRASSQNVASESPISMEQLMQSLRIRGGNWSFVFSTPVIARITSTVSSFPDGKSTEQNIFISDHASTEIALFFMDAPAEVGDYPRANRQNTNEMRFKLSDCKATAGTRLISYVDKFSMAPWVTQDGKDSHYRPCIAVNPELKKEYVLSYYARDGDPYMVLATICFVRDHADLEKVDPYTPNEGRDFTAIHDDT